MPCCSSRKWSARVVDLNDGAEVTLSQSVLGKIPLQNHGVEIVELHAVSSGKPVMNLGKSSPCLTIQTERSDEG